jgi:protein-L-isoaspartate(D-aspartate) O-methyltransferase
VLEAIRRTPGAAFAPAAYATRAYDVVSAACPGVPSPLAAQLRAGGRLVQPVGPGGAEHVVLYQKQPNGLRRVRIVTAASFVRLHGRPGFPLPEP